MTELISNFSFLAPSMHDCNFFATLAGKNWSLRGSNCEAGRKAYSFITVSASPPKNSMYSPEKRERERECVCVCVCERERVRVTVRERVRVRVRVREK